MENPLVARFAVDDSTKQSAHVLVVGASVGFTQAAELKAYTAADVAELGGDEFGKMARPRC